ncbi:hypothetical protein ACHLJU_00395 [Pediococcus acidilactici]|uniref:hypothetical protein n=1 Tax=Pediococcus acidilactici TaxID=1254 RepID=UPI003A8E6FB3
MENEQIKIDAEKFAYHFMDSIDVPNEKSKFEDNAKNKLIAFLSAFYLIKKFNAMEKQVFNKKDIEKVKNMSYKQLLEEVSRMSYF